MGRLTCGSGQWRGKSNKVESHKEERELGGEDRDASIEDYGLFFGVFPGWLKKKRGRWSGGSRGAFWPEFRPPGYHRLNLITPQRSFTTLRLACLLNPAGECTLIRLGAPNNRPCVPQCCGRSGGNQQTTSDQHGRDVSKGHKSPESGRAWGQGRGRQTDGEGATKVADWSSNASKPVFIQEVLEGNGRYSDT